MWLFILPKITKVSKTKVFVTLCHNSVNKTYANP